MPHPPAKKKMAVPEERGFREVTCPMRQNDDNRWLDPLLDNTSGANRTSSTSQHDTGPPGRSPLLHRGYEHTGCNKEQEPYNLEISHGKQVTRFSAAAVIVLAMTWFCSIPSGGFGKRRRGPRRCPTESQHVSRTLIIRGTKTFTLLGRRGQGFEFDGSKAIFDLVKYFSAQQGLVEEGYVGSELILPLHVQSARATDPACPASLQEVRQVLLTDAQMRLWRNGTPKGLINLLMEGDSRRWAATPSRGSKRRSLSSTTPAPSRSLAQSHCRHTVHQGQSLDRNR
jgi:hypothetical protein